ncbi:MAG: hypothetical protein CALGDGBN_00685 [Pseudomonadales bacterium]|nr:hypothetical protein [Pseudomonadales bacterium]
MICDALASVVAQTYPNLEVLVVDDGSVDDTANRVASIVDERIRYFWKPNGGVSSARNCGVARATGKYVAFLDSDDVFAADCISKKLSIIENVDQCVVVGSGCRFFDGVRWDCLPASPAREKICYEDLCVFTAFPGGTSNIFAVRDAVIAVGGFDESLSASEDRDFLRKMCLKGKVLSHPDHLVAIRVHGEFRPNRDIEKVFRDREAISRAIPEARLRMKSSAWNAVVVGDHYWSCGNDSQAIRWWIRSYLTYPFILHRELGRTRRIIGKVVGRLGSRGSLND